MPRTRSSSFTAWVGPPGCSVTVAPGTRARTQRRGGSVSRAIDPCGSTIRRSAPRPGPSSYGLPRAQRHSPGTMHRASDREAASGGKKYRRARNRRTSPPCQRTKGCASRRAAGNSTRIRSRCTSSGSRAPSPRSQARKALRWRAAVKLVSPGSPRLCRADASSGRARSLCMRSICPRSACANSSSNPRASPSRRALRATVRDAPGQRVSSSGVTVCRR